MGEGHAKVCGQLLGGRAPVAHGDVFAGAHQDDALSSGQYLRNHLLTRLVISEGDRPAVFVVAVTERLHMLVPGTQELRELAHTPLRMTRVWRIADIADHSITGLRFLLD